MQSAKEIIKMLADTVEKLQKGKILPEDAQQIISAARAQLLAIRTQVEILKMNGSMPSKELVDFAGGEENAEDVGGTSSQSD